MTRTIVEERRERLSSTDLPYLSHSRVSRYLHCPEQYRLYYVETLRLRVPSANLVFGKVLHRALAYLLQTKSNPVPTFLKHWQEVEENGLTYSRGDSWESLEATGRVLLEQFVRKELPRLGTVQFVEKKFTLKITELDLPLVGVIDLVAPVHGKRSVVDFKTSNSSYGRHEAMLSDQLTAYQLAEPETEQLALCVFVKTKKPRIEWHVTRRDSKSLHEYLRKAAVVSREIQAKHFYRRPGRWCAWCDYLPICMGDTEQARKSLVQIR